MSKSQEFEEKQIAINGLQVNYTIAGSGPNLLVLHGWGKGSGPYKDVQVRLAQHGYKVVVPDLPGFGKSSAPATAWGVDEYVDFVLRFVDVLGLGKFFLLGHSFGGQVALQFSVNYPDRIEGLILCAAAAIRRKPDLKKRIIQIVSGMGSILFSLWPFSMFSNIAGRAFYRLLGSGDWRYSQGVMKYVRQKVVRQDLSSVAPRVISPTLIIWGDRDQATPIQDAYTLNNTIPGSSLEVIPGVGHRLYAEAPEQFTVIVKQFLAF